MHHLASTVHFLDAHDCGWNVKEKEESKKKETINDHRHQADSSLLYILIRPRALDECSSGMADSFSTDNGMICRQTLSILKDLTSKLK